MTRKLQAVLRQFGRFLNKQITRAAEELGDYNTNLLGSLTSPKKTHEIKSAFADASRIVKRKYTGVCLGNKRLENTTSRKGTLITGTTGSGKSSKVLINSVLSTNLEACRIIHDPSCEIYEKTASYLQSEGFTIIRIDFANPAYSHGYNPLERTSTLSDFNKLATTLVSSNSDKKGNDFWSKMAIKGLVILMRISHHLPKEYNNLFHLSHLAELMQSPHSKADLDTLVVRISEKDEGLFESYSAFISQSDNTLSGILSTMSAALSIYSLDEQLAQITSYDRLGDFTQLRKQKTAIYVHSSTANMAYYSTITSLFFTQYFECFFRELPSGEDRDVYFLLDETPILRIFNIDLIASNIRKYRGNLVLFCQDEMQLEVSYGKQKAGAIVANMNTRVYLSCNLSTARNLESELGEYEYKDKETGHTKRRSLMTKTELLQLKDEEAIVTTIGKPPVKLNLIPYYKQSDLLKKSQYPPLLADSKPVLTPKRLDISTYLKQSEDHLNNASSSLQDLLNTMSDE